MSELKTKQNDKSVLDYLNGIENEARKSDCLQILGLFEHLTGETGKIWGKDIVGFGSYHYKGKSGRKGEWFPLGFSSRKANITIYIPYGFKNFESELSLLGKHKTSAGCLYIKSLESIELPVLKKIAKMGFSKIIDNSKELN